MESLGPGAAEGPAMRDVATFLLAYLALTLAPGPNFVLVACKAMAEGRAATRPLIVGLCLGTAALLAATMALGAAVAAHVDLARIGPLVSGAALGFVAYALAPAHRRRAAPRKRDPGGVDLLFGVSTGALNPISATFFLSETMRAGSALRAEPTAIGAAIVGVLALCFLKNALIARLFASPRWREAALRNEAAARTVLSAALAGYAGWTAAPVFLAMTHASAAQARLAVAGVFTLAALAMAATRLMRTRAPERRPA
jgi:threonine/homoserine/homoserine lactone efflux protein